MDDDRLNRAALAKDVITQCLAGNELLAEQILRNLWENGLVVVPRKPTEATTTAPWSPRND